MLALLSSPALASCAGPSGRSSGGSDAGSSVGSAPQVSDLDLGTVSAAGFEIPARGTLVTTDDRRGGTVEVALELADGGTWSHTVDGTEAALQDMSTDTMNGCSGYRGSVLRHGLAGANTEFCLT